MVKRLYHAIVLLYGNSLFICSYVIWKIDCMEYENLSLKSKSKKSQNRSHASRPWCWFLMLLVTLIYWKYSSDGRWNSYWKWQSCKGPQMLFRRQMMGEICRILCANIAKSSSSAKVVGMQIKKIIQRTMSRLKEKMWQNFFPTRSSWVCHQLKSSSANNMKIEWHLISW